MGSFSDMVDKIDLAAFERSSKRRRELERLTPDPQTVSVIMMTEVQTRNGDSYVFFYGGIYSQWHHAPMTIDGRVFNCAEQWMMYNKATLFGAVGVALAIMATPRPDEQKALGRKVKGYDDAKWASVAQKIVFDGNLAKFTQHQSLRAQLLATGDALIVECSPTDERWGIGLSVNDPRVWDPRQWRGSNWLGQAIMKVRDALRKPEVASAQ